MMLSNLDFHIHDIANESVSIWLNDFGSVTISLARANVRGMEVNKNSESCKNFTLATVKFYTSFNHPFCHWIRFTQCVVKILAETR